MASTAQWPPASASSSARPSASATWNRALRRVSSGAHQRSSAGHGPAQPVIVISAVDRQTARQREVLITDHTVFLRKPFDIEALLTLVERLTGSPPR